MTLKRNDQILTLLAGSLWIAVGMLIAQIIHDSFGIPEIQAIPIGILVTPGAAFVLFFLTYLLGTIAIHGIEYVGERL